MGFSQRKERESISHLSSIQKKTASNLLHVSYNEMLSDFIVSCIKINQATIFHYKTLYYVSSC